MKWRVLCLTSLLVLSPITLFADTDLSSQIQEVQRQRTALVEEQAKLQAELDKISNEGKSLGTAVKSLDATRKKLATDIKVTQSKIKGVDLNIQTLQTQVGVAEKKITTHREALGNAIKLLSQYDAHTLAADILASANFSELWSDQSALSGLNTMLNTEVDSLKSTKALLTEQEKAKEESRKQIVSLNTELTGQKLVVEESQKAKEKLLAETKSKEALYQQLLADNRAKEKEFEDELFRLESGLNLNIDASKIPNPAHNILSWPLASVTVTQKFGKTVGAERLYASGTHNGIDFRASQGTRVLAVLSGVIQATGNTDEEKGCGSYGRWILIKHPNGLSSIYGHLSASVVQAGQVVSTGQVIGYSGGTPGVFGSGYSTGPHLHLGLFASQGVEVRQFVESKGCKLMTLPIADVKAYLDPLAYLPAL